MSPCTHKNIYIIYTHTQFSFSCIALHICSSTHTDTCLHTVYAHICLPGGAGGGSLGGGPRGGGPGGRPGGGPGGGPGGRPGGGPGGKRRCIGPLKPPGIPGGLKNGGAPKGNRMYQINDADA